MTGVPPAQGSAPEITLIIPAHNEEGRLAPTLHTYASALEARFGDAFEVVVVANACVDATAEVARNVARQYPHIRVIDVEQRIGKGGAVLVGFGAASAPRLVFADADAATAPGSLLDLFDKLSTYDIVIGSRHLSSSRVSRPQSPSRQLFGVLFAFMVRRLFGLPYRDTQCGAKALRADAAQQLTLVVTEHSWTFDLDLLLCARAANLRVLEHPVNWADQPGSQLRFLPTLYDVAAGLWRMKVRSMVPADRDPAVAVSIR